MGDLRSYKAHQALVVDTKDTRRSEAFEEDSGEDRRRCAEQGFDRMFSSVCFHWRGTLGNALEKEMVGVDACLIR